ncbi:MAG: Holliday junction branch migration protein RuvA [Lachnospiraceae bacterium]|nr:Holliday junction branch migration protein RuvA [Lachnospiraceae bacterium]
MIAYIKGTLDEIGNDYIVLDVNNIGYLIKVSLRVIEGLPAVGSQMKIHTYMYVREDIIALYGFLTKDDLQMFLLLLGVNGVGPKGALGILSMFSAQELRLAIISQDVKTIAKSPGIGAKTAQRILIDLKDKVSVEETFEKMGEQSNILPTANVKSSGARGDAIEALTALGYSASESMKAVNSVEVTEDMSSDAILKQALKYLF